MGGKLFLFVFLLLTVFSLGNCLKCYTCMGTETSDCYQGVSSSIVQDCTLNLAKNAFPFIPFPLDGKQEITATCIQVVRKRKEFDPPLFQRSCAYAYENQNVCDVLAQIEPIEKCKACDTDLCNGSAGGSY